MTFPSNAPRMAEIEERSRALPPQKFRLGERVQWGKAVGVIAAVYSDLKSAVDAEVVDLAWYQDQEARPATLPTGRWYEVIVVDGALLCGEDDLRGVES